MASYINGKANDHSDTVDQRSNSLYNLPARHDRARCQDHAGVHQPYQSRHRVPRSAHPRELGRAAQIQYGNTKFE